MKNLLVSFEGTYGIGHIIYIVLFLILLFVGWVLVYKFAKTEKSKKLVVKISGGVLLALILWNRICITVHGFLTNDTGARNLLQLIPLTFCGSASFLNAIGTLFGKEDNKLLHCVSYFGLIGGIITLFYPDFLDEQAFFDARSLSGMLHHTTMIWVVVTNMITGYVKPCAKKWYLYPLGLCILMTVGLFFHEAFDVGAMQIGDPLLGGAPIFTSWYVVGFLSMIIHLIIIICFEKFKYKKSFKEIFVKDNWF